MPQTLDDAKEIVSTLQRNGYQAYLVGGCVRDMKMGLEPHDYDIATNATPDEIHTLFPRHLDTGIAFGTVTVMKNAGDEGFEVTTFRKDGDYSDGRHPDEVVFSKTIEEDLARRDFTMNAIAYNPSTKTFVDPYNGADDIQNGVIRCVGDPVARFREDPLRVLRAMRFAIKLGFAIEKETGNAMRDAYTVCKLSEQISKERITKELAQMFASGKPIYQIFNDYAQIVTFVIPELARCLGFNQNNKWHKHNVYEHTLAVVDACDRVPYEPKNMAAVKFAALLHDIGKPECYVTDEEGQGHFYGHPEVSRKIAERVLDNDLSVTKADRELILDLVEFHDMEIPGTKAAVKRLMNKFGEDFLRDWLVLKAADLSDHTCPPGKEEKKHDTDLRFSRFEPTMNEILAENSAFKVTDLAVNGGDVLNALSIKPGPVVGEILRTVLEAVMDEKIPNEREVELDMIKQIKETSYPDIPPVEEEITEIEEPGGNDTPDDLEFTESFFEPLDKEER